MTCTGSWDAEQVAGEAVDITGLTLTATYADASTENVTAKVTYSPTTWSATPGTQTVTFSYTAGGATKTTTKSATVVARVADPVISCSSNTVTMTCSTASAVIHYTSDGTTPTAESTTYSGAITITETKTFKAIAVKSSMANSNVVSQECEYEAPANAEA